MDMNQRINFCNLLGRMYIPFDLIVFNVWSFLSNFDTSHKNMFHFHQLIGIVDTKE